MTYSTPSERWSSSVRRFVGLRPLDGTTLARAIWRLALVLLAAQFILATFAIPSFVMSIRTYADYWMILSLVSPLVIRTVEPLLWLLIIRLVLEVCMRALQPGASPPISPSEAEGADDGR